MTATDDHLDLRAILARLLLALDAADQSVSWDNVHYVEVADMADRVRALGLHLSAATDLGDSHRYESAFALTRTALEHAVMDWLIFRGRTFIQRVSGIDEATWADWNRDRDAGAPWTRTIRDWTRTRRGDVRIIKEGLSSEPDDSGTVRQLSIYYFLLQEFRPTVGPPSAQRSEWGASLDQLRKFATENEEVWRLYLTWSALTTNLKENGLVSEEDAGRLTTHYRFLSGYAHPVSDQRRRTYGRNAGFEWPAFDHYSSELVLLYAVTLAALELENFASALAEHRSVALTADSPIPELVATAHDATEHFWFLGDTPHAYDVWAARNQLQFAAGLAGVDHSLVPTPTPNEVPYSLDPLQRLVALHCSTIELSSGLGYESPWPRMDAQFR